jgi:hypothetical protein
LTATQTGGGTWASSASTDLTNAPNDMKWVFQSGGGGELSPNTIEVSNADVFEGTEGTTAYTGSGTVKIGSLVIGTVSDDGKLSFTLPATVESLYLNLVNAENVEEWSVTVSDSTAKAQKWDHLDIYSSEQKTGEILFGTKINNVFRKVKYMYFDKACTINGIINIGNIEPVNINSFHASQGWNLFHPELENLHSNNFEHFINEFKWVFTAVSGG